EEMREAGAAYFLVLAAHVVPDVDGDHRRLVVLVHDEREPVVEHELRVGNVERRQRRRSGRGAGADGKAEREQGGGKIFHGDDLEAGCANASACVTVSAVWTTERVWLETDRVREAFIDQVDPVSLTRRRRESTAHHGELVAVRIAHVGGVEVRVVQESQTRGTLGSSAMGQRSGMETIHRGPVPAPERHHAAVADGRRRAVEGFAHPQRVLHRALLFVQAPAYPPSPARFALLRGIAALVSEDAERCVIEHGGALEIVRPQADVREHGPHDRPSERTTSAIHLRRRRSSRAPTSSPSKLAGCSRSRARSTLSKLFTLTTA